MKYWLGTFLQVIGITEVGLSLFIGLTWEGAMLKELSLMLGGVIIFYLGRFLEAK
jgi:hypothetical protein